MDTQGENLLHAALVLINSIANNDVVNPADSARAFLNAKHDTIGKVITDPAHLSPSEALRMDDLTPEGQLAAQGIDQTTLQVILQELANQRQKWGVKHIQQQTLPGHILILNSLLRKTESAWLEGRQGDASAQATLVKVASVALHAVNNEVRRSEQLVRDTHQPSLPLGLNE